MPIRWPLPLVLAAGCALPLVLAGGCALPDADFDADGWSVLDGDCDDFDAEVHPVAEDPIADGLDQDCDGIDAVARVNGESHTCELSSGGRVHCWGANQYGQLEVPQLERPVVDLAAGRNHTCALDDLGVIACWGDDSWGQASPPAGPFGDVEAGAYWTIGVQSGPRPRAVCWGLCVGANRG